MIDVLASLGLVEAVRLDVHGRLDVLTVLADDFDLGDDADDAELGHLGGEGVVGRRRGLGGHAVAADFPACRVDQARQRQAPLAGSRRPGGRLIDDDADYEEAEDEQ